MSKKEPVFDDGTLTVVQTNEQRWIPWAMEKTYFKLLSFDERTGRFSIMIKVDKGVEAFVHRHVGAVEVFMLEGEFHYPEDPSFKFTEGSYLLERDGAVHQPISTDGAIMVGIFHGPLEGLDAKGNVAGRVDWKWHVDAWRESGQTVPGLSNKKK